MKRKSPHKHTVHKHTRNRGRVTVHSYTRGKGKPIPIRRVVKTRKATPKETGVEAYTVDFQYSKKKGDGESVVVFAPVGDYRKALDEAFEERVDKHRTPILVEIEDPSLGAAISFVGRGAGRLALKGVKVGARLGAKYTVKVAKRAAPVAKAIAIEVGKTALTEIQKRDARRLLRQAYAGDRVEKYFARKTLRRRYPALFDKSSFSPPRYRTPSEKVAKRIEKVLEKKPKKVPVKKILPERREVPKPEVKPRKKVDYSKMTIPELKTAYARTQRTDQVTRWEINRELKLRGVEPLTPEWIPKTESL